MSLLRTIAHFDLDSFFVSVEYLSEPGLRGKPVIVGGQDRGVVSTCSYEARAFGVHSGMSSSRAKQLCPQAIFVKGSYSEYSKYSRWVTQIIAEDAPLFEKASVDEFYLDLTGMEKYFDPLQFTINLRERIIKETGLPISFGLASNKMMAKMATNAAKPNGYLQIPHGAEQSFLAPLPVDDMPGVGESTKEVLQEMKLFTLGDVFNAGVDTLENRLGKSGADLWVRCKGIHTRPVSSFREAKSISSERTFSEDKIDTEFLLAELVRLTEKISFELRSDGKLAAIVTVKIRYPDFVTQSRQCSITATHADDEIIPVARELFAQLYKKGHPVRLLGVRLSGFEHTAIQADMFTDRERKDSLYKAIDNVKNRFGTKSVKRGSSN